MSQENTCPFCSPRLDQSRVVLANELCYFLQPTQRILLGAGIIVPWQHRETVFDLTNDEALGVQALLGRVKQILDRACAPDGYNVGWNCGAIAGQEVFHAHMHVIPRFADEPLAGKGIRYWLKQETNRRPGVAT